MKRRLPLLLAVLLVLSFALVGCGSKEPASKLEGTTWELSGGKDPSGIEVTAEQMEQLGMTEFTLEFKKDGVVTVNFAGESQDGTWSEKDGVVTIGSEGENMTLKLEDDVLSMDQDGTTLMFKEKK